MAVTSSILDSATTCTCVSPLHTTGRIRIAISAADTTASSSSPRTVKLALSRRHAIISRGSVKVRVSLSSWTTYSDEATSAMKRSRSEILPRGQFGLAIELTGRISIAWT